MCADPALGPVYTLKVDISDGIYRIDLRPSDAPNLVLILPTEEEEEPQVAISLKLPMGWKNSPPIFCKATEIVVDLTNDDLHPHIQASPHHMNDPSEQVAIWKPPPIYPSLAAIPRDPMLGRHNADLLVYVEIFVDNFLGSAQEPAHHQRHVCRTIFHYLDQFFRPKNSADHTSKI